MEQLDLAVQRGILEAILNEVPRKKAFSVTQVPDLTDLAVELELEANDVAAAENNHSKRMSARLALLKLRNGKYAICSACMGEIAPKRLKASAWAVLCIMCHNVFENGGELAEEYGGSLERIVIAHLQQVGPTNRLYV